MNWSHGLMMLLGGVIGAALFWASAGSLGLPFGGPGGDGDAAGQALAQRALVGASRTLVSRDEEGDGSTFFSKPRAYGDYLCRVERVHMPNSRDGDWKVEELYAPWTRPSAPAARVLADASCAQFRAFDQLIAGDAFAVQRALSILDRVKATPGAGAFKVSCSDRRTTTPKVCDGLALLRAVKLSNLQEVIEESSTNSTHSSQHVDQLYFDSKPVPGCSASEEVVGLKIISTQAYGEQAAWEGTPTSLEFTIHEIC